jgi:hypothetical protein
MGECVQNIVKTCFLLILTVFLGSCMAMDAILPSGSAYKINIKINSALLDECSFAGSRDIIRPYFEEPISDDPDVTGLMLFLKDATGGVVGWKVIYNIDKEAVQEEEEEDTTDDTEQTATAEGEDDDEVSASAVVVEEVQVPENYKNGDELIIPVRSLNNDLPAFPVPRDLPMGRYTIVSQVMSENDVLQKTEKTIFYLGRNAFSYEGIKVYMPGIGDNSQLIPRGTTIMLSAELDFDSRLNPYIIWYDGKQIISEGQYSQGAGSLFWKTPEQSGFFSLRAEVFPVEDFEELVGYKKGISLLISSKTIDVNLISENIPQLIHWYTFEADLSDSKMPSSAERTLSPLAKNSPKWMGANGTYGVVTDSENILALPKVFVKKDEAETWQTVFRFKPLNDGSVFSIQFGAVSAAYMNLFVEGQNLVLTLISPLRTVSQRLNLFASSAEPSESVQAAEQENSFITAGISFSILPGRLSAQINIIGDFLEGELAARPISINVNIDDEFQIMLGANNNYSSAEEPSDNPQAGAGSTALWDEFALYYMPPMEIIIADIKPPVIEEIPVVSAGQQSDVSSEYSGN